MNVNIPTEQFKRVFHPTKLSGWKRAYLRCVAKVLILHDRTFIAKEEPTKKNIVRAVVQGIIVGGDLERMARVDSWIVHPKKFPKDWYSLVSDETNRIMDEEELALKETPVV